MPRLYGMYHAKGMVSSFAEFLVNLFAPLFEVSVDPRSQPVSVFVESPISTLYGYKSSNNAGWLTLVSTQADNLSGWLECLIRKCEGF